MRVMERAVRLWIRCGLYCAGVLAITSGHVWATSSCHSNPPLAYTLNFPATVAVARDLPVGSPLTAWISTPYVTNYWTCNQSDGWYTGTDFEAAGIIPNSQTSYTRVYDGLAFPVYTTNVPGVGMALGGYIYTDGLRRGPFGFNGLGAQRNKINTAANNGGQLVASLVKIGNITPGTVTGQLAQAFSWESATRTEPPGNLNPAAGVVNFYMTPVVITVLTCQTPDVTVDMGTQTPADFPGVGAPSNKSRSFNLSFNNCPAGGADASDPQSLSGLIHSVQYRIDPVSPDRMVPGYSNVVALDSGTSQASGIGIQLYDSTGAVVPMATLRPLGGFDGTKASSYSVSMKANYFRTGAISPGTGNVTMYMTVQYE